MTIGDLRALACVLLLAATSARVAAADLWRMEPVGSRLEFIASFQNLPAPGVFKEFDLQLRFDPGALADSRLDVTIDITSADMNSAEVNAAIESPVWFDFARFGTAEFHADDIEREDEYRFLARGVLDLKGVQQPLEVPFTWSNAGDAATMQGEFRVRRGSFGIGTGEWAATDVIGPDVTIRFSIRLHKAG